ncbi:MAG: hypothetical protein JWO33_142, partial [Caulobacteraceae bacterium]|nr:hypothetical protein [Caulobacteraceae bacterium]
MTDEKTQASRRTMIGGATVGAAMLAAFAGKAQAAKMSAV